MGTRSLTHIVDASEFAGDDPVHLVTFYRQYDGYPEGLGKDLSAFIQSGRLVNGIGLSEDGVRQFNGAGCFAAALIADQKDGPGNVYIHPPSTDEVEGWQEYEYIVRIIGAASGGHFIMEVSEGAGNSGNPIFAGTPQMFDEWVETHPFGSLELEDE